VAVIDLPVDGVGPRLVASPGPRYFAFVSGGAVPAALAADWVLQLLELPSDCSVGS
jgi:hypothetical protein